MHRPPQTLTFLLRWTCLHKHKHTGCNHTLSYTHSLLNFAEPIAFAFQEPPAGSLVCGDPVRAHRRSPSSALSTEHLPTPFFILLLCLSISSICPPVFHSCKNTILNLSSFCVCVCVCYSMCTCVCVCVPESEVFLSSSSQNTSTAFSCLPLYQSISSIRPCFSFSIWNLFSFFFPSVCHPFCFLSLLSSLACFLLTHTPPLSSV